MPQKAHHHLDLKMRLLIWASKTIRVVHNSDALDLPRKILSLPDSSIDPKTFRAYQETEYRVHGDAPFILKIGVASPGLAALHNFYRVESSAFITACNPFSEAHDDKANVVRQDALAAELRFRSLLFIDGLGQHPSNQWPGEASFLVMGVSREAAKALGTRLERKRPAKSS
jgi:hypothetical protein